MRAGLLALMPVGCASDAFFFYSNKRSFSA